MSEQLKEIESVVVPMKAHPWLIPSALVAEVLPLRQPERPGQGADWLLGWLTWRGVPVPLISFERFNESGQVVIGSNAKILILNSVNEGGRFYALIVQGEPKRKTIRAMDLQDQPEVVPGQGNKVLVQLEDTLAMVPDLDAIEAAVKPLTSE